MAEHRVLRQEVKRGNVNETMHNQSEELHMHTASSGSDLNFRRQGDLPFPELSCGCDLGQVTL